MEEKGFVSNVSPTKRTRAKAFPYFEFQIQTGSRKTRRVVCYDNQKETEIRNYSESGQPLKLMNLSERDSLFFPGEKDLVFNKRSKLEPAHNSEIDFECLEEIPTAPTTIKEAYSVAENVIITVNGRLHYKIETLTTISVRGKDMDMLEQCTLTDETTTIKITLWDNIICQVHNGGCYSFSNVRVKQFDGKKYLTTTANTVVKEDSNDFPQLSDEAFDAFFEIKTLTVETIELLDAFKKHYSCKKCKKMVTEVTSDAIKIMKCKVCGSIQELSTCSISTSIRIAIRDETTGLLWLTLFDKHLKDIVKSDTLEEQEVSISLLQLKNFKIQYHTESLHIKNVVIGQEAADTT